MHARRLWSEAVWIAILARTAARACISCVYSEYGCSKEGPRKDLLDKQIARAVCANATLWDSRAGWAAVPKVNRTYITCCALPDGEALSRRHAAAIRARITCFA